MEAVAYAKKRMDSIQPGEDFSIEELLTGNWHSLVYGEFEPKWDLLPKTNLLAGFIAGEPYIKFKAEQMAKNNLGLSNGLTGLGMLLLSHLLS